LSIVDELHLGHTPETEDGCESRNSIPLFTQRCDPLSPESKISEHTALLPSIGNRVNGNGANGTDTADAVSDSHAFETRSEDLKYWHAQLSGELPRPQLPYDRSRPSEESHRTGVEHFELPESIAHGLKRLSETSDCSLHVSLLAGTAMLLQRYSGQDEIMIGGGSDSLGKPLALRVDLSGDPNFIELQSRLRAVHANAMSHTSVPFSEILKEVLAGREMGGNPLFNVSLSQPSQLPGEPSGSSAVDLNFSFEDRGGKLRTRQK